MSERYTKVLNVTLSDTNWHSYGSSSTGFGSLGPKTIGRANDRILRIHKLAVTTNAVSICYGDRAGNADGGTRGIIYIPDPTPPGVAAKLAGCSFAMGNAAVSFVNTGSGSAGTVVDLSGKTHAAVVAEFAALVTAGTTGIADLEVVDGVEPGVIALQSDAADTTAPVWTLSDAARSGGLSPRPYADGLGAAGAVVMPTQALQVVEIDLDPSEDVRVLSLRANTANATVVLEVVFERAGPAIR